MKAAHWIAVMLVALFCGYLSAGFAFKAPTTIAENTNAAYDRVMQTGEIRCGYALWPPSAILKDPATGKLTGIFVDIFEEAAASMNLKVVWAEETGWGSYIESLESKRFDVFCAPLWRNAEKGMRVAYSVPLFYSALHFYARQGDNRFDDNLNILNDPAYKLATMDGEISAITADNFFPKAEKVSIPQLGDITQLFLSVGMGKADGVFLEPSLARDYADNNPGKIRQVTKEPFSVYPNSYGVLIGETKLQSALDSALIEMLNQGKIDKIIEKYEPDRSIFMPVAKNYTYIAPAPLK